MEQHLVGPVLARLESARAFLFAAARLSLVHQRAAHFPHLGHAHHVPAQRVRARTGHVVPVQEAPRLSDGRPDAAATPHRTESPVDGGERRPRQSGLLGRRFHRVRSSLPPPFQETKSH